MVSGVGGQQLSRLCPRGYEFGRFTDDGLGVRKSFPSAVVGDISCLDFAAALVEHQFPGMLLGSKG